MKYEVMYGNGTAWMSTEIVEMDERTTDYGAILDKAIDQIEEREGLADPLHKLSCLMTLDEVEKEGLNEDEYVVGGNHGLALVHYGNFTIREDTGETA